MKKSYLFVFNNDVGTREQLTGYLDRMSSVVTWRYDMTNAIYIISESSADVITKEFESIRGLGGRYIFSEYNSNSQGRLTGESWFLLNNKYHQPKQ